jgi:O-antigen/teichoic acid export membrane protein
LAIAAAASMALTRIDRLVLGAEIPPDVLAQYAASMYILEAAVAFSTTLMTVVGAKILFKPGKIPVSRHAQLLLLAAAISVLGATLISLTAGPLVTWIFGNGYADSAHYLRIGAWILPLVFVHGIIQAPLLLRSTKRFFLVKSCVALGIGAVAGSLAVWSQQFDLLASGAYLGFFALISIDSFELHRRAGEIYGSVV